MWEEDRQAPVNEIINSAMPVASPGPQISHSCHRFGAKHE